jgi:cell division protein FtsB
VRYDEVWGEWSGEPAGLAPTKGGEWVKWEDYARLKAEVESVRQVAQDNKTETEATRIENARLKAEVERLTFDPLTYLDDQGEWMPRHIHLATVERLKAEVDALMTNPTSRLLRAKQAENAVLAIENDSLQAEVERLRKAGDAVSLCLEAYWKGKPYDVSITIKCFDAWNAAKDGKPSV